jgi:hypothetical protein
VRQLGDLRRCGILHKDEHLVQQCDAAPLRQFELDHAAALETVQGYLDDLGIADSGRYGDWATCGRTRISRVAS